MAGRVENECGALIGSETRPGGLTPRLGELQDAHAGAACVVARKLSFVVDEGGTFRADLMRQS
jgi:hypothetical protein